MKSIRIIVVACALLLFGCGGGGGGGGGGAAGPTPATNLAGTWAGTNEDPVNVMSTLSVTIDATGKITQVTLGGVVQAGLTGNIFNAGAATGGGSLYSFTLSDGTKGGFFADASVTHVAFLLDDTSVGVLQKGAGALPVFAGADIASATWSGYNIDLDANLNITQTFTSSINIANDATRTFTGTATVGGAFTGSLPVVATATGRWTGTFTQGAVVNGTVHAFLSTDKTFAAAWSCPPGIANFVSDCGFSAWHK
jgi:hypothetical protein